MKKKGFNQKPVKITQGKNRSIYHFEIKDKGGNLDKNVVEDFGEEWRKFADFSDQEIEEIGQQYFDIIDKT